MILFYSDICQFVICAYLDVHEILSLSMVCIKLNDDVHTSVVWSRMKNALILYPKNYKNKFYYAADYVYGYLNYNYFDNYKYKHDTDCNMQIRNWQKCDPLLRQISKTHRMHPKFFDNFTLDYIENIFIGCILRNHNTLNNQSICTNPHNRYLIILNLINTNKLTYSDMKYIYCLHEISSYASNIRNASLRMIKSISLQYKSSYTGRFDKYIKNLLYEPRDYKSIIVYEL